MPKMTAVGANALAFGLLVSVPGLMPGLPISAALAQCVSLASLCSASFSAPSGSIVSVAEPSSLALMVSALGLASFAMTRFRRRRPS